MPEQESIEPIMPPPPAKREAILSFGRVPPQQAPNYGDVTSDVNALSRRLRLLEESFTNLRRFFQVTEKNALEKNKNFTTEIKTLASDIMEIKKEMQDIRDKLFLIIKELQTTARKDEVKVLEKYINLWNPIKFVSHNEVEQIINEVLEKKGNRKV